MFALRTYKILAVVIAVALFVPACGSSSDQEALISTAVAQTVQAGGSPTQTATLPSPSPTLETPDSGMTLTPAATSTGQPTLASAPSDPNCAKASLVAENPPDKTIMTPGAYFWKTWTLLNTGTCTWTTAFSLIFWDGDRLGSSISYPLSEEVAPGEQKDITIYLQAPATTGSFTGYWRLKTPWNSNFGVGQYDTPISTSIVVGDITPESHKTETVFGVTSVTYTVDRECTPANTIYTITAYISVSGPVKVDFMWIQSDGNNDLHTVYTFKGATTKAFTRTWAQGKGTNPTQRWVQVIVTSPAYQEFDKVPLPDFCYFKP